MIVPMKKVTLLCVAHSRETTLERLRDLGVVHLQPLHQRESEDVETARRRYEYVRHALDVLPTQTEREPSGRPPKEIVEALWNFIHELRALDDEQTALTHEQLRYAPFGDFDPAAIQALRERGIFVRLFQAAVKAPPAMPEEAACIVLRREKTMLYFVVVSLAPVEIPHAQGIPLPTQSPADVRRRLAAIAERRRTIQEEIARFAGDRARIEALLADAEDRWRFAEARAGMGVAAGEAIAYLQGFCPAEKVGLLREAAAANGWGLVVDDPGEEDRVPTLLRFPRWVKPIRPVLQMIGILPGYREVDISAAFLVFLSLFFAILVGDAGYGALFLVGGLVARRRFPKLSPELFTLLNVVSVVTIVWGVLSGVYFGFQPAVLNRLAWPWLQDPENVKWLAFTIGAVHLSLAHVWNIVRYRRSLQAMAQIGWLCTTWTMYFVAQKMVLGRDIPSFVLPMFGTGVALIVLFMTPLRELKREWFNHAMLPLNLVSNFVDVISYIRLFAVGTASFAVANSFNASLTPLFGHWVSAPIAALFLVLAHGLNIILCLMGVMVHGVRLNTLEFSGHVGMQWTGLPFRPFRSVKQSPTE